MCENCLQLTRELQRLQGYVALIQADHARRSAEVLPETNWRSTAYVEAVASIVSGLEPGVLKRKGFPTIEACIRFESERLKRL